MFRAISRIFRSQNDLAPSADPLKAAPSSPPPSTPRLTSSLTPSSFATGSCALTIPTSPKATSHAHAGKDFIAILYPPPPLSANCSRPTWCLKLTAQSDLKIRRHRAVHVIIDSWEIERPPNHCTTFRLHRKAGRNLIRNPTSDPSFKIVHQRSCQTPISQHFRITVRQSDIQI